MIQTETLELLEWSRLCQHLATFAATKLGSLAARQLRIPDDRCDSETLLAQTQEVYQLESLPSGGLKFEGIQDIGESLQRAERRGILLGVALLDIATTLAGMRTLRRVIDDHPDLTVLNTLVMDLRTYPELEQEIHRCIDDQGKVTDRASSKLAGIREQQQAIRQRVQQILHSILQRQTGAVQEQLITQRYDRFVIPVKAPQKDAVPGIVHDTSTSGATLYIEPNATVPLNNQLQQLLRQEQREEEIIRQALTEQVAAVQPDLELLLAVATTLDLATARARYSRWLNANPPRFIDWGAEPRSTKHSGPQNQSPNNDRTAPITLRQLRHPLLVWQQNHEQGRSVVPIDLIIQPHIRVVAITGPNTGGKTATLKTLGITMLMAKVGLFIPAREPVELPWFQQVLADIGDEQSLQQSLSTFSGHIRRISRILAALPPNDLESSDNLDPRILQESGDLNPLPSSPSLQPPSPHPSLVLLDEVGAGTDPSEGSALAIALLKQLADRVLLTVATTHFGELKALKYQDDRFENASVEFDEVSLSPTYRLLWGIPGRSNALTIARRLGLEETIVAQAQTLVGGFSEDINQVIRGLEDQRRTQEEKAKNAANLLKQAEHFYQQVSERAKALQQREQELKLAQEQAVQQAIVQAKGEIATVIRQLQQGPQTAQAAQQATTSLNQMAEKHVPTRKPATPKQGFVPKMGDRIRIPRLGQVAEVFTLPDEDGKLNVRFGLMKMVVGLEDIESLDGEKPDLKSQKPETKNQKPASREAVSSTAPALSVPTIRTARNTLDIRGSRVADAEPMLDRALAEGDTVLWVIHGHGTGKLRQGVHAFLQQHPSVSHFTLAEPQDGGSGVTIVHLKN